MDIIKCQMLLVICHDTLSLTIDQPVDSVWYVTDCDIYVWPRNRTAYNTSGTKVYGPYMVPENVCQNYDTLVLTLFSAKSFSF